jgi:hypothetical protein
MRIMFPAAAAALLIGVSAQAAVVNLPGQQSTIRYSTTSGVTSGFRNYARATSKVVYDSGTDTYTVRDTGSLAITSSFGPGDISSSTPMFTTYSKNSGAETFRLLNQSALSLTYVDYGEWKRTSTASGTTTTNDTYVVFGTKTPRASMPHSGGALYSTIYDGNFVDKDGEHALDGTGSMSADFLNGTLNYSAAINGAPGGALAFSGSGSINYNSSGFTTTDSSSGYTLSQYGNFYGPGLEEVGGLFRLNSSTGNGQGAFVGN